jgi:hypothetical protein
MTVFFDSYSSTTYDEIKNSICIVGDSHSRIWARICGDVAPRFPPMQKFNMLPEISLSTRSIMSATACGLNNQQSVTRSNLYFSDFIKTNKSSVLMIHLGQVDIEFVMKFKNRDIEEQTRRSISAINEFCEKFSDKSIILVPVHTHEDAMIENIRYYNECLKNFSMSNKRFLLLNPNHSEKVTDEMMNVKGDSHIDETFVSQTIYKDALKKLVDNIG